jgi:hypothetical protein
VPTKPPTPGFIHDIVEAKLHQSIQAARSRMQDDRNRQRGNHAGSAKERGTPCRHDLGGAMFNWWRDRDDPLRPFDPTRGLWPVANWNGHSRGVSAGKSSAFADAQLLPLIGRLHGAKRPFA